jgi:hypothetical protein
VNAVAPKPHFHAHGFKSARGFHRSRKPVAPFAWIAAGGAPYYYYPVDALGAGSAYPQTLATARPAPAGEPVNIGGRICFAQTYVVPSEAGGVRSVTINRC